MLTKWSYIYIYIYIYILTLPISKLSKKIYIKTAVSLKFNLGNIYEDLNVNSVKSADSNVIC